jgi:uncharacterized protein (DUF1778 family)
MAKTSAINMRVDPEQRDLLTRAASAAHLDRTAFILQAACREANNVLLDQRRFTLEEGDFTSLEELLDQPIPENSALTALLSTPAQWE